MVIAEAGVNHNGDPEAALHLVDAAADSGADAVKFQAFKAERVAAPDAPKAAYQRETTSEGESQLDMLRRLELSVDALRAARDRCAERGILFLSSVFDEESVGVLEELDVPAIKLGSGEVTNIPLLERVARAGKPVILSTGMAALAEVERALDALGTIDEIVLLHATTGYPADPADANLRALAELRRFGTAVGYSDHTPGDETALAAVALGACVVEKHVTLDRSLPGPDHAASLEPAELKRLVDSIRVVEAALGTGRKEPASAEAAIRDVVRRSLAAARPLPSGTVLTEDALIAIRPGTGISPDRRGELVGRTLNRAVGEGEQLAWDDVT
jgi:N-acetylneuraminate synthase/N,N'-diacetyllegionaminate synthase